MAEQLKVGFIGLGFMGRGMAANILKRGFPLTVMAHRKRTAIDALVAAGAVETRTPAEIAARSDVVILCVTGAAEVDALVRGPAGIAAGARPGLVVLDCTTSNPETLVALARDHPGLVFVDGPLGRSPREAEAGTLSIMIGADPPVLDRIRPVLAAFAYTIQHVGALGDGHRLKLVNNLVSMGFAALYAEALVLARKSGLTTAAFDQLIRSSRMHSAFYDTFMGWALEGNPDSHPFALATAEHTATDVAGLAQAVGMKPGLAAAIQAVYRDAVAAGYGAAMLPELPRFVAAANGFELTPAGAALP
jgi:3-hydroxyisobutyrate dehydrogenase-like beta-hydroxyacid dehydrogenase